MEQLSKKDKDKKRTRSGVNRVCTTCQKALLDCISSWRDVLGARSAYCSLECVQKQVDKANEVIADQSARVMLLDRSGTMLNGPSAPKLAELLDFLKQHAEFAPSEQDIKAQKQSASKVDKLLSKENDQRRFQVRRAISEKLIARAKKTPDLAFTSQEIKALSQRIEEELFRQCRQSGFYLRTILGEISVPKLVSLDATELSSAKFASEIEVPKSRKSLPKIPNGKTAGADGGSGGTKAEESKGDTASGRDNETDNTADFDPFPEKATVSKLAKPIKAESEVDKILGMEPVNTTAQHRFHLFDMNCDICTGKKERELMNLQQQKKEQKEKKRSKGAAQDAALQKPREKEERKHLSSSWRSVSRPSSTDADDGMGPDDDFDDAGFPMDDDDERPDWNTSCPSTEYRNEGQPRLGARVSESWRALPEGTNTEDSGSAGGFVGETWRRPIGIEEEMLMYDSWRS
ncbi:unnamed protein product, partial [Toxocara canis]|uniref:BRK domain-containing protein n=1 Tax=Toxocara canis TaxID=6265 RepID=A0A183VD87_TOXCA